MNRPLLPVLNALLGQGTPHAAGQAAPHPARKNVVRILDAWYVACQSDALKKGKPFARTILGVPLALWRDEGGAPAAVVDRCPHRNVPLSIGRVPTSGVGRGELECPYHGWRFDGAGRCTAIPGLCGGDDVDGPGRRALAHPVREQDGYVWVWMNPLRAPTTEPFALEPSRWKDYVTFRYDMTVDGTLHSTLENILDVPHTAFLHGGLFRTPEKKHVIDAIVQRRADGVQAQFLGEPRPPGLAARILTPSAGPDGTAVEHWDRFFLPSIAQVEYRLGSENHLVTTTCCTPVTETVTLMFSSLTIKTRLPIRLVAPVVIPFAWRILAQDRDILRAQTAIVDRFGTESFSSTPIDLLGPHILHLLKKAEQGKLDDAVVREERVQLKV